MTCLFWLENNNKKKRYFSTLKLLHIFNNFIIISSSYNVLHLILLFCFVLLNLVYVTSSLRRHVYFIFFCLLFTRCVLRVWRSRSSKCGKMVLFRLLLLLRLILFCFLRCYILIIIPMRTLSSDLLLLLL